MRGRQLRQCSRPLHRYPWLDCSFGLTMPSDGAIVLGLQVATQGAGGHAHALPCIRAACHILGRTCSWPPRVAIRWGNGVFAVMIRVTMSAGAWPASFCDRLMSCVSSTQCATHCITLQERQTNEEVSTYLINVFRAASSGISDEFALHQGRACSPMTRCEPITRLCTDDSFVH